MLKNFVLAVTGNSEISKDTLSKQHNYICVNETSLGLPFLRRILKHLDLAASVSDIEDRFLPDKDLLLLLLQSLQKGQKVQLQKIRAVEQPRVQQDGHMSLQDKENVSQICDMFGGQHPRQVIEAMYIAHDRNFERTLEQCLAGQVPKDEIKVVVVQEKPANVV